MVHWTEKVKLSISWDSDCVWDSGEVVMCREICGIVVGSEKESSEMVIDGLGHCCFLWIAEDIGGP